MSIVYIICLASTRVLSKKDKQYLKIETLLTTGCASVFLKMSIIMNSVGVDEAQRLCSTQIMSMTFILLIKVKKA